MSYFNLYAGCVPVNGISQSILCDLQRDAYVIIPNELYNILSDDIVHKSVEQLISEMGDTGILEWFNMFIEKEFGFFVENKFELKKFPKIELGFFEPKPITNAIIDLDETSDHNFLKIFRQLSDLLCETIEFRFFYDENVENIVNILNLLQGGSFRSVEVLVQSNSSFTEDAIKKMFEESLLLHKLVLHGSEKDEFREIIPGKKVVIYTSTIITSEHHCGVVRPSMFVANTFLFSESTQFNSCLNKKVSIDRNGFIKNCPSMTIAYGHISTHNISDIVKEKPFQEIWNINKDKIEDCKVCEFRYICQDCRAYINDPNNLFSKPIKCTYNPYEATWK